MKNIKSVISLALLAVAPTIYAQNIDTKAAPDVPTFSVTLNVTNNGGGSDTLKIQKQTPSLGTAVDSVVPQNKRADLKLIYGTKADMILRADTLMMLESFTVNGEAKSLTAEFPGTTTTNRTAGHNYYTVSNQELKEKTDIVIKWVAKPEVKVTVSGTEQIVKSGGATEVSVTTIPNITLTKAYYSDKECTKSIELTAMATAGTYYVKLTTDETADHKAVNMVVPMVINNKTALAVGTAPTCETVLMQGQPLSAAVITGGEVTVDGDAAHVIKGTWSWADPNALVEAGAANSKKYAAIFTPDSAAVYNTVTAEIGVGAKPVKIVTVNQTAGGVVAITNASADNKYIGTNESTNPKIKVTATPDAGYKFDSWTATGTTVSGGSSNSEDKVTSDDITITADAVVSAKFVKATRTITFTSPSGSNNTLKVLNGTQEVTSGAAVPVGTTLTIVATPGDEQEVVKVGYTKVTNQNTQSDDPQTEATSFIVSGAAGDSYTITATFQAKPRNKYLVSVADMTNGALKLEQDGKIIAPNSSVEMDSYVSIIALPNKGYKLSTLIVGNDNIKEASGLTVTKDVTIIATFEKETYPVSVVTPEGVSINVKSDNKVAFETSLGAVTVTETDPDNYRLINLLVNNKPVANGSEVIVNGPTNISAQVKKLAPLSILNDDVTTVTYSGKAQEYAVKTTANLGGFSVKYLLNGTKDTIPTGVGTYTVEITRPADDVYAATKVNRTLVIEPGVPGIKMIPFAEAATGSEIASTATVAGIWTKTKPTKAVNGLRADDDALQTVYFIPADNNLMTVTAVTPKDQSTANSLAASVKLPAVSNGSIVLMNGDIAVAAGQSVYEGQELTIKLIPDAGFMIGGTLTGATATSAKDVYTLKLTGQHEISVKEDQLFVEKTDLSIKEIGSNHNVVKTYTGNPIELKVSDLTLPASFPKDDKWVISYRKDDNTVTPTNVIVNGGYGIYISRPEDGQYKEFTSSTAIGTLTINPAKITGTCITVPTATAVTSNETLLASSLTGGSVIVDGVSVPGTFSWQSNTEVVSKPGMYNITFTPTDQLNYTVDSQAAFQSYVSLKDASSYVMTLNKVNDGAITITDATGSTIDQAAPSIKIAAGMKLFIKTAATGTKIDNIVVVPETTVTTETTGDKQVWSFIAPAGNFTVTVTFTKESTSEGGNTPGEEGVAVTGISLNKTTLTLPRLKSEKLVATVTPTGATKKDVKWTSTNPEVATVDADGTVKAVKYGQATIIATTVDGGFTAMCQVNVDFATAIEKILSESLVYSRNGQIIIEPAAPVEISIINLGGQVIYNNSISSTVQVPANNGVYIVRMAAAGKATTTKVIVR